MSSVVHTVLSNIEIIDSKSFLPVQDNTTAGDSGVNQTPPDTGGTGEQVILEQVEEHPYDLSYTCLLLPRFESHYLIGDLVASLQTRLQQICISFGWRLELLSIQPDHMQWTMRVPPTASTAYFMQVIREQTSRHIFADFPRFKRENASDDFWAPGYLIVWGAQPHPAEIIQRYARQTRQQQGLRPNE
jgi:REP element-mobilizing transposase RayT